MIGQNVAINGIVISEDTTLPIPNAHISIYDETQNLKQYRASSNHLGEFSLNLSQPFSPLTLHAYSFGYKDKTVVISQQDFQHLSLIHI